MRRFGLAFAAAAVLGVAAPSAAQAQVGGCLKYGLGGAIVGHFAGGNRLTGAALGCALGVIKRRSESRAEYNERVRRAEIRQRQEYETARRRGQSDQDFAARRDRRGYDPDATGSIRGRQDRYSPDQGYEPDPRGYGRGERDYLPGGGGSFPQQGRGTYY
jgi:hypothetical protein